MKKNNIESCEHCNTKFILTIDITTVISGKLVIVTDDLLDEIEHREGEVSKVNESSIDEDSFDS